MPKPRCSADLVYMHILKTRVHHQSIYISDLQKLGCGIQTSRKTLDERAEKALFLSSVQRGDKDVLIQL